MTTHAETADATHAHAIDHASAFSGELRFEKSELHEFVEDDRTAGQAIGKLLAIVFALSLVLMSSVTVWSVIHKSQSPDPHEILGIEESAGH